MILVVAWEATSFPNLFLLRRRRFSLKRQRVLRCQTPHSPERSRNLLTEPSGTLTKPTRQSRELVLPLVSHARPPPSTVFVLTRDAAVSTAAAVATCRESACRLHDRALAIYAALQTTGNMRQRTLTISNRSFANSRNPRLISPSLGSVHSCPNTPCFRCRLTGHRAKDCTSRRWAKDMCWRCLRTDRCTRDFQHFRSSSLLQPLTMGMQSRPSFVARAVVASIRLPELRKDRSAACDFR